MAKKEQLEAREAECSTLDDFKSLARKVLKEQEDPATARSLYRNASSLVDGPEQIETYASGMIEIFDDRDWAEQTLAGAEGDCMFPSQFVALAARTSCSMSASSPAGSWTLQTTA